MAVVGCIWNLSFKRKLQEMKKARFSSSLILQTHRNWLCDAHQTPRSVRPGLQGSLVATGPAPSSCGRGRRGALVLSSREVSTWVGPACLWEFSRYTRPLQYTGRSIQKYKDVLQSFRLSEMTFRTVRDRDVYNPAYCQG